MSQHNGPPRPRGPQGPVPQVAMRQQVPPEEVMHRLIADIQIGESEDGTVKALTFVIPAPNKQYTFLIPAEAAKELGQKLIAPRVEVPAAGLLIPEGSA